jgi:hypothetical protein
MEFTSVVLPTPGPPVMITTRSAENRFQRLALAGRREFSVSAARTMRPPSRKIGHRGKDQEPGGSEVDLSADRRRSGFQDAFHDQLASSIYDDNRDRCLVNIHADILRLVHKAAPFQYVVT